MVNFFKTLNFGFNTSQAVVSRSLKKISGQDLCTNNNLKQDWLAAGVSWDCVSWCVRPQRGAVSCFMFHVSCFMFHVSCFMFHVHIILQLLEIKSLQ